MGALADKLWNNFLRRQNETITGHRFPDTYYGSSLNPQGWHCVACGRNIIEAGEALDRGELERCPRQYVEQGRLF